MRHPALNRVSVLLLAFVTTSSLGGCSSGGEGNSPGAAGASSSGSGAPSVAEGPSASAGTGATAAGTGGAVGSGGNPSPAGGMGNANLGGGGGAGKPGSAGSGPAEGGRMGAGGAAGSGGQPGSGGGAAGTAGSSAGGGPGSFNPCPASGACKVLPLGDSITWGVNYDGGYRVKVFADATTDQKNLTFVGKLSNGPTTVSGAMFPKNNEGHSGWTIQQLDDIVTGKSTDANYNGKKLLVDLAPHIVLLHAGTNDTSRMPTGMPDRLGTLIDHIVQDAPDALLVVTTIVPIKQGSYGAIGETFDNAIPAVVQTRIDAGKHIVLVDMFKSFPSNGLGSDGVHPNQQGYEWMAGVWYAAIKSYLH